ncbi:MAG: HEAT repeat domain-containing protein, partial [Gemmataceae bacterium]
MRHLKGEIPASVVECLRCALYFPNCHIVEAALGSAGILRLKELRSDILSCLDDTSDSVVHSALFALGRVGEFEDGEKILPFLARKETHLGLIALTALSSLKYRPAIPDILQRLQECRKVVRKARLDFELPRRLVAALVSLEAREAIPLFIDLAREEIGIRGVAVRALIDLRAEQAGPALTSLLGQLAHGLHEEKLTCSLLKLMSVLDYRFALPEVRACLEHRLASVRMAALQSVAQMRDLEAVEKVRRMIREDPSAFVRPTAVQTLADLLGSEAKTELEAFAGDANALVREAVASVLHHERLPTPNPPERSPFPVELQGQVAAARAFLHRWRDLLNGQEELDKALEIVLR